MLFPWQRITEKVSSCTYLHESHCSLHSLCVSLRFQRWAVSCLPDFVYRKHVWPVKRGREDMSLVTEASRTIFWFCLCLPLWRPCSAWLRSSEKLKITLQSKYNKINRFQITVWDVSCVWLFLKIVIVNCFSSQSLSNELKWLLPWLQTLYITSS